MQLTENVPTIRENLGMFKVNKNKIVCAFFSKIINTLLNIH